MAAVHLVGFEAEALASVPPRPWSREHAVVAAEQVPGRRRRPRVQRPRLAQRAGSLGSFAPLRIVATKTDPPSLVQALIATARLQLVFCALLAAGLAV